MPPTTPTRWADAVDARRDALQAAGTEPAPDPEPAKKAPAKKAAAKKGA